MHDLLTKGGQGTVSGPAGALEVAATAGHPKGRASERNAVAIVCHPHPQHGGTMDNKVVTTLARAYRDLGVDVVRFNFRGVGGSAGEYDAACGEVDDLVAVAQAILSARPDAKLLLAGFSFGASVAAQGSYRLSALAHLVLVAPPVPRYHFDREGRFPAALFVIQGDRDERVEARAVREWAASLAGPVDCHILSGAGHFFHGYLPPLKRALTEALLCQWLEVAHA